MDSYYQTNYQSHNVNFPERTPAYPEQQTPKEPEVKVSHLARRIHGWSWQAVCSFIVFKADYDTQWLPSSRLGWVQAQST